MPVAAPREVGVDNGGQVDAALRYHRVIDILDDYWKPEMQVLELGSGAGGIARYLNHPVTGVDIAFDRTVSIAHPRLTPIEGSVTDIPADDRSFDAVVSVEMMEHLPVEARDQAVSEMWRVLRPGGVAVVTFPAGAPAQVMDGWLNETHKARRGAPHPWVSEHIEQGVPEANDITSLFEGLGADVTVTPHLSMGAFWWLHGLYGVGFGGPILGRILWRKPVARAIFRRIDREQVKGPAYRAIVTATKPG